MALQVGEDEFGVAAKLPKDLAAGSARRRQDVGVGYDGDAAELSGAFGDSFHDSHALSANGEAVSGILHVAAGVDPPAFIFDSSSDFELGKWRESMFARCQRGV
jgi:hypothetical protein